MITEQEFTQVLADALDFFVRKEEDEPYYDEVLFDAAIRTFSETGLLTTDKGLVIRLADGSEFQLTVIRSK